MGAEPRLRLTVAGRGYEAPAGADPRVEVLGFVDQLEPLYARAACALVPLLSGGGSPVKFIEALAHGLPVVATPRGGRRAWTPRAGATTSRARAPTASRGRCWRRSTRPGAAEVGAAGRTLAESDYSIEALARRLAE